MNYDIVLFYRPDTGEEVLLECLSNLYRYLDDFGNVYVVGPGPDFTEGKVPVQFEFPFDTPAIWITEPTYEYLDHYCSRVLSAYPPPEFGSEGFLRDVLQHQVRIFIPDLAERYVTIDTAIQFCGNLKTAGEDE